MLRKRKGLTLVEIIVAMAVFAIVVATLLPAFVFVARLNVVSKAGVDITAIAQQEAEKFYGYSRNNTYTNTLALSAVTTAYTITTGGSGEKVLTRNDAANHVTIVVTLWDGQWDGTTHSGMTKIRVIASIDSGYNYQNVLPEQIDSILLFKLT